MRYNVNKADKGNDRAKDTLLCHAPVLSPPREQSNIIESFSQHLEAALFFSPEW